MTELTQNLKSADEAIRIDAAEALGKVSSGEAKLAAEALAVALTDKSAYVRQAATRSLAALGPNAQSAVPALRKSLNDSDQGVRIWAEQALQKIEKK